MESVVIMTHETYIMYISSEITFEARSQEHEAWADERKVPPPVGTEGIAHHNC